jgi:hypothetical protein
MGSIRFDFNLFAARRAAEGGISFWAAVSCSYTINTGDPDNIHPKDKREVGERVAFCALPPERGSCH